MGEAEEAPLMEGARNELPGTRNEKIRRTACGRDYRLRLRITGFRPQDNGLCLDYSFAGIKIDQINHQDGRLKVKGYRIKRKIIKRNQRFLIPVPSFNPIRRRYSWAKSPGRGQ